MKKALIMLLIITLLAGVFGLAPVRAAEGVTIQMVVGSTKAYVNSKEVALDQPPVIENGRTLVPFRFIGEALGATIEWNADTKTVTYLLEDKNIVLTIGSKTAYVNGVPTSLDVASKILSGRTMVPVRFISESVGANVKWDDKTRTVTVTYTPAPVVLKRSETLYTGGKQWGPVTNWNPFLGGNYAMGTVGLCYETLFLYDPLADKFIPWLAESGSWKDSKTYEVKIRQGVKWTDGQELTADDVKFTFELGKQTALFFSGVWDWLSSITKIDNYTLDFKFTSPLYQEWDNALYGVPIVPQHIWSIKTLTEVSSGANERPIGSGPYVYFDCDPQTKMIWKRNDNWWAIKTLGFSCAPKYIVDLVNTSNENALGLVLQGQEDLNNNYLPGISSLLKGGYALKTYYSEPPYHLAANTAWLVMNLQEKPLNDIEFRKALAASINVSDIVSRDYENMVSVANPTGLLPMWDKYVDQDVVKKLGITYDLSKAKKFLADAGYKDVDGDGFVENKDGSKISLKLIVPNGWSDWMAADQIIANSAKAAGIKIEPSYPDYNGYLDQLLKGTFDLAIDNRAALSNTPWTYYRYIFYDKLEDIPTTQTGNFGRYNNKEAFDLVTQLDKVPTSDLAGMKAVISKLQTIQLTDLPIIPLWYNGVWAQMSTTYWTNWPSAEGTNHNLPCTWNGYWNMTAVLMLTELKPVNP